MSNFDFNYIRICDDFLTIQGEGSLAGSPSLFIRLSGCNLKCSFCDEPTHRDEGKILFEGNAEDSASWVMLKYKDVFLNTPHTHVVISGGEPTIYVHLNDFVDSLREQYSSLFNNVENRLLISVESNGYRPQRASHVDLYTCSPKFLTEGKAEKGQASWIVDFLKKDEDNGSNFVDLKYLYGKGVNGELIVKDIVNTLDDLIGSCPFDVSKRINFFISPINDESTICDTNVKATLELLKHPKFSLFSRYSVKPPRLSMQLHKILGVK